MNKKVRLAILYGTLMMLITTGILLFVLAPAPSESEAGIIEPPTTPTEPPTTPTEPVNPTPPENGGNINTKPNNFSFKNETYLSDSIVDSVDIEASDNDSSKNQDRSFLMEDIEDSFENPDEVDLFFMSFSYPYPTTFQHSILQQMIMMISSLIAGNEVYLFVEDSNSSLTFDMLTNDVTVRGTGDNVDSMPTVGYFNNLHIYTGDKTLTTNHESLAVRWQLEDVINLTLNETDKDINVYMDSWVYMYMYTSYQNMNRSSYPLYKTESDPYWLAKVDDVSRIDTFNLISHGEQDKWLWDHDKETLVRYGYTNLDEINDDPVVQKMNDITIWSEDAWILANILPFLGDYDGDGEDDVKVSYYSSTPFVDNDEYNTDYRMGVPAGFDEAFDWMKNNTWTYFVDSSFTNVTKSAFNILLEIYHPAHIKIDESIFNGLLTSQEFEDVSPSQINNMNSGYPSDLYIYQWKPWPTGASPMGIPAQQIEWMAVNQIMSSITEITNYRGNSDYGIMLLHELYGSYPAAVLEAAIYGGNAGRINSLSAGFGEWISVAPVELIIETPHAQSLMSKNANLYFLLEMQSASAMILKDMGYEDNIIYLYNKIDIEQEVLDEYDSWYMIGTPNSIIDESKIYYDFAGYYVVEFTKNEYNFPYAPIV